MLHHVRFHHRGAHRQTAFFDLKQGNRSDMFQPYLFYGSVTLQGALRDLYLAINDLEVN